MSSVWSVDLTQAPNTVVAGTCSTSSSTFPPGDAAVWIRWKTDRYNTKGKPIYLRKYYHGALVLTGDRDAVAAGQKGALDAFGLKMRDGTFTEGRIIRSQKQVETLIGHGYASYVTTRTLKRRGKRPGS